MLVDVRTRAEYEAGHLADAKNVPVEDIMAGNLGVLTGVPQDTPLRLYCRSGARANYARQFLQSVGFSDVVNLGSLEDAAATV
ncbi:MAG: rhodanese-like domain-containing protein [Candidatus Pacebacteria bacterium]|nr:rhodanese-like domain-containing protein [Candidatus Paceibacterota bacterium]